MDGGISKMLEEEEHRHHHHHHHRKLSSSIEQENDHDESSTSSTNLSKSLHTKHKKKKKTSLLSKMKMMQHVSVSKKFCFRLYHQLYLIYSSLLLHIFTFVSWGITLSSTFLETHVSEKFYFCCLYHQIYLYTLHCSYICSLVSWIYSFFFFLLFFFENTHTHRLVNLHLQKEDNIIVQRQ